MNYTVLHLRLHPSKNTQSLTSDTKTNLIVQIFAQQNEINQRLAANQVPYPLFNFLIIVTPSIELHYITRYRDQVIVMQMREKPISR